MSALLLAHLRDLFAPVGRVSARAMFGGHGLYFDGAIIGVVIDEALYLKVDAHTRDEFVAAGCAPLVYRRQGRSVPMSYWSVPEAALDSPQALRPWALRAIAAARRTAAARRR